MGIFGKKSAPEVAEKKDEKKKSETTADKVVATASETKAPIKAAKAVVREKHVLIKPLITEKVTDLAGKNQYVFAVHPDVNKIEIKNEIKKTYKVEPIKVNIMSMSGKHVRFGRTLGKQKNWKKAIVILKKGDTIEVSKAQ